MAECGQEDIKILDFSAAGLTTVRCISLSLDLLEPLQQLRTLWQVLGLPLDVIRHAGQQAAAGRSGCLVKLAKEIKGKSQCTRFSGTSHLLASVPEEVAAIHVEHRATGRQAQLPRGCAVVGQQRVQELNLRPQRLLLGCHGRL